MSWPISNDGIAIPDGRARPVDGRAESAGAGVGSPGALEAPPGRTRRGPAAARGDEEAIGITRAASRPERKNVS